VRRTRRPARPAARRVPAAPPGARRRSRRSHDPEHGAVISAIRGLVASSSAGASLNGPEGDRRRPGEERPEGLPQWTFGGDAQQAVLDDAVRDVLLAERLADLRDLLDREAAVLGDDHRPAAGELVAQGDRPAGPVAGRPVPARTGAQARSLRALATTPRFAGRARQEVVGSCLGVLPPSPVRPIARRSVDR
jgi:hypothetical protein